MWCQVSGGEVIRVIPHPTSLTINSTQYPRNIFTIWEKSELKAIGLMPYREEPVNQRYHLTGSLSYNIGSDEVVGTYASSNKDVAGLKKEMVSQTKQTASGLLQRDDWMVVRASEGGTAVPDNIKTYRTAVRKESNDKETEINALSNLDAVKLYEATPYIETRKEENVDEDGKVTYGDNYTSELHLNLVTHYFADDPTKADDPAFVSLVKK
jgi:hypothetical protein